MKRIKKILLLIICILIVMFIINEMYFFNPFTFKSTIATTGRSWYEYRNPLRIEYEYWNTPKPKNIWAYDENEIRFIFNELNKSKEVDYEQYKGNTRFVWLDIRRLKDDNILLVVDIANNKIAKVGDNNYVEITDELWNYILKVQQRETVN